MTQTSLIRFLQEELGVSASAIAVAQRFQEETAGSLPIILWQYGLITLEQLNQVFDWMETV